MKLKSVEEIKSVFVTSVVETEEGNVVVKENYQLNDDGSRGKFIDTESLWEKTGENLSGDPDNYGLNDDVLVFLNEQNKLKNKA
jgi:hypothetical protein